MRPTLARLLAPLMLLTLAVGARGEDSASQEKWYVIEMQGQRAGWAVEREIETAAGKIRLDYEMSFKIGRMGQDVELTSRSGALHGPDGEILEMRQVQDFGMMTQTSIYRFERDAVVEITEQLGRQRERRLPRPGGDWLSPMQASERVAQHIADGDETFSVDMIDVSTGLRVNRMSYRIDERTQVEAMGKVVPAIKWIVTNSIIPGVETLEYVDEAGETVRTELDMAGLDLVILESEKELALSPFDGPELMASTLISPDKPIDSARWSALGEFIVSVPGGEMPDLPTGGAQRVERLSPSELRVIVDVDNPLEAPPEDLEDPRYLEASTYCDIDDPEIMATLVRATRGVNRDASKLERAREIEAFVREFVDSKSLGVGFATASEVCATRQGDCSEHAVLLCALLRADGIPSRGVSGLVYVDQFVGEREVFGYHMWSQALIEVDRAHRWIDLDAAVYPFDATHIAVTTSSLGNDDVINSMVGVAETLGELQIRVISVE